MADELDDTSRLVAVHGMTPEQFALQTAVIRGGDDLPAEGDLPGSIVMRADYDGVRSALAKESEAFARLTDTNKTIADALQAVVNGARIASRKWNVDPDQLKVETVCLTGETMKVSVSA